MMSAPMSQLPIKPLQRLIVNDGLLLTAQLWQLAHDYHRQRQNIYYQSLYQPGIVCGLEVRLIKPPTEIAGLYKDKRWLEIQPGIAIDVNGNPIIVPQPLPFRISSNVPKTGFQIIYIVLEYVDPDDLINNNRQLIPETFRINEKTISPEANEIELCRILLQQGSDVELFNNVDVLNPGVNNLDLRYRQQVKVRCSKEVKVAWFGEKIAEVNKNHQYHKLEQKLENKLENQFENNLEYLLESIPTLYPDMEAKAFEISDLEDLDKSNYDLLYLNYQQFIKFQSSSTDILRNYLETGAIILIEASIELEAAKTKIDQQINNYSRQLIEFAQKIGTINQLENNLSLDKIIRTKPFLFSQLPIIQGQPIHLYNWGGIILIIGSLSKAWGIDDNLSFNRETIRSAQEMGINILHFASYRHQLTQYKMSSE